MILHKQVVSTEFQRFKIVSLYYRMYAYDDSALPYSAPVDIILLYR